MRNHLPFSLVFALALLGDATSLYAQARGSFNRVATAGARGSTAASPSSSSRATSVGRSDGSRTVVATAIDRDTLSPYTTQSRFRTQGSGSGVPQYSTRQEQPVATREVIPQAQSRTYFPGMRSARAIQQPVTLTAGVTGARHICTPSRSRIMGSGGAHR
jgi:hypothetical protein